LEYFDPQDERRKKKVKKMNNFIVILSVIIPVGLRKVRRFIEFLNVRKKDNIW
tara:strand:- start:123 stop:281 length:159 start_codon:yes stop_codon:yes gene_type:complete